MAAGLRSAGFQPSTPARPPLSLHFPLRFLAIQVGQDHHTARWWFVWWCRVGEAGVAQTWRVPLEGTARYIAIARPPPHWFVEPLIGTALYQEIYIGLGCGTSGFSLKSLPVSSRRLLSTTPRTTKPTSLSCLESRYLTTITSPPFLTNVLPHGISFILL